MKYLITLILLFLPVISSHAQEVKTLTIEEAIDIALQNNYQLKQAENNLDLAETRIWSARADFLPSLNAQLSANRQAGLDFIPEDLVFEDRVTYSVSGNLSTNIPIFTGFRNIANLRSAGALKMSQEESLQRLRENIIFNTASRYLQVVLNEELLKIAEASLEASNSQLEQVRAQVEVGARPTVDLYNQESLVANDELEIVQRQNALDVSVAQLLRIMQDESIADIETSLPAVEDMALVPVDLNLQELIQAALESRSDYRAQEYLIESNESEIRIQRSNMIPSISANASLSSRYSDQLTDPITGQSADFSDQFFDRSVTRSAGVTLQIPIFNRWNNRTSMESAQIQLKNSRLELDNLRFQVSEEVRQAYNDYQSIVMQLESTDKALRAAERAYETELQRYEIGATTLIELNQANANFVQAQSNRVQTIYNFVFQKKILEYYLGRVTPDLQIN